MMHEPMLLGAIAVLLVAAALLLLNGARKRRLMMKIEPVPPQRLDATPERSEILGEVRVRERGDVSQETAAVLPDAAPAPVSSAPGVQATEAPESENNAATLPEPSAPEATEVASAPVTLSQADLFPEDAQAAPAPEADALENAAPDLAIDRVVSIHVMASAQLMQGRKLLELLLQYGLRFGDMQIFHRHEHPAGQGDILFSMAQAVEPGTFNIETLERDLIPGVSFFMSLPGVKSTLSYDLMIDTARRLAQELQADLLDSQSQPLTTAVLEQWRAEVVAYERQQLQSL